MLQLKANANKTGFTLIELMIVMSIVALLMSLVGPLAINSVEKAQAKQEMLTLKNWLRKVSHHSFFSGTPHRIEFQGNLVSLYKKDSNKPKSENNFEALFFPPQVINYNKNGFVDANFLTGTYRGKPLQLDLIVWINGEIKDE